MPKHTQQTVKYELLPPVGPDSLFTEGQISDLLFDIPYFFIAKIVPPIQVVNEILQKGVVDAGMSGGCRWTAFQLDAESYARLAADLRKMGFVFIQPPDWVESHSDWLTWCGELVWGIPALVNKQQRSEICELDARRSAAIEAGDDQLAVSLLMEINELCARNMRFVNENRASKPKLPVFRRPKTKRKLNRYPG